MGRRLVSAVMVAGLVAGAVLVSTAAPAAAAHPGANGRLAYSDYSGIWTANPDGSDPQRLTTAPFGREDRTPEWSPGGTRIVFQRGSGVPSDLYVVNADGSGERELWTEDDWDYLPAFSPDAARVTFTSSRDQELDELGHPDHDIWTARPDGSDARRLTFDGDGSCNAELSRWSPDRTWIAFEVFCSVGQSDGLHVIRPDGTGRRLLTDRSSGDGFSWSPDGRYIVYPFAANGVTRLYRHEVATGAEIILRELQSSSVFEWPAWSPDGSKIAFLLNITNDTIDMPVIHTMPAAGGPAQNIGIGAESVSWQPLPDVELVDARFSPFVVAIDWLYDEGLTSGCGIERYCPGQPVLRGELASFLARALELPAAVEDHFTDDESSIHEDAINRLADAGLTAGCAENRYCPNVPLSRDEMASFLARAFDLDAADGDRFTDDDGSIHEDSINRVADAGITTGCAANLFCPNRTVTRGEMAAFLERALDPG